MTDDASALNIILIDDHPAVRKGLSILLGTRHQIRAEAKDKTEALALLDSHEIDIALLDLTLQDGSGLDLLPELEARDIAALVYTMHEDAGIIKRAFHCGALGYVSKQEDADILFSAIEVVAKGKRYLSPCAAQCLHEGEGDRDEVESMLSDRERQIFQLMGQGCGNTEIAEQLGLSRRTVETYCNRMVKKFDFEGRSELRKYAISAS